MKLRIYYLSVPLFVILILGSSFSLTGQGGVWTWMSGSEFVNSPGNYGVKGVSDPNNEPPPRYQAAHWKDKDGVFWMYGGVNFENFGRYSDLWKFDPILAEWTWVNGPNTQNNVPVFGEKGVPSPSNLPPPVGHGALCWYDGEDGLYLYGGLEFGGPDHSNMWKYSISLDEWVWLTGSEFVVDPENAGVKGISSPNNTPGMRFENESCWMYDNKLWFACGQGQLAPSSATWYFDFDVMEWTWIHGPLEFEVNGEKGIEKVFDEANYPGSRATWSKWSDKESVYIFSGSSFNDLWHFNVDTLAWRFLGEGSGFPFWEDYCTVEDGTQPSISQEMQTAEVIEECKEVLWLFGSGMDQALWAYDLNQDNWALAWGSPGAPIPAEYGTKGVPSLDNVVENRNGGSMWSDAEGNLWIYGGFGYSGIRSDTWRFEPDYSCLNLADTSECCELTVSFRISNTIDSSGSVEIQVVDGEGVIEYSIDGGMTWSTDNFFEDLPPGDYEIVVRDSNGCIYTGTITILDISVSTTNLDNMEMSISPNPVKDILTIRMDELSTESQLARIRVIDQGGRLLIMSSTEVENSSLETKLSLQNLIAGNYYIQILLDDKAFHQKISKN